MYAASSIRSDSGKDKRPKVQHRSRSFLSRLRLLVNCRKKNTGADNYAAEDAEHVLDMQMARYKPESLDNLCKMTNFSKKELKIMYRGFKQECPCGIVNEDTFKQIYSQFFPQGNSSSYAHYVFNAFDKDKNGSISFEEFVRALSMLSRGSIEDKLRWVFTLYDTDGNGRITKDEFTQIVSSIYEMMGKNTEPPVDEHSVNDHISRVYQRASHMDNESLTMSQFVELCQNNEHFQSAMHVFDTQM